MGENQITYVQLFFSTGQNGVAKEPAMLELNIVTTQPNVIYIVTTLPSSEKLTPRTVEHSKPQLSKSTIQMALVLVLHYFENKHSFLSSPLAESLTLL